MQDELVLEPIKKGRTWRVPMQRGQNPLRIISSTNATPIVVEVEKPHGYSNGQKVRISGQDTNKTANGNWEIANVTAKTFSLVGSAGIATGIKEGYVSACVNGNATTLTCKLKSSAADTTAIATPAVNWIDRTIFQYELVLTPELTAALANGTLVGDVKAVDASNTYNAAEFTVSVIDSVT